MRVFLTVGAAAALVVLAQAAFAVLGFRPPRFGPDMMLAGPDAYMWLLRVEQLWQTGAWFDTVSPLTNAPYGESMHFTRPLDVLLLAGAWPLSAVLGMSMREALFVWGSALSPLLEGVLVVALWWGTRPFLSIGGFLLLVVLIVLQPSLYNAFMAARPDHQSLQILLFGFSFIVLFRVLTGKSPPGLATLAGAVAGLALWVSVEAQVPIAAALVSLGLMWLWEGGEHAHSIRRYLIGVTLLVMLALAIERPPDNWLQPEMVRISVVYLGLFACLTAVWSGIAALSLQNRLVRLAAGLGGIVVPALAMYLVFPQYFEGPFAGIDVRIWEVFINLIPEYQPLMPTDISSWGSVVILLGPVILGIIYAAGLVHGNSGPGRAGGVYLLVALLLFTGLALYQVRWGHYAVTLMVIAWTLVITAFWRWTGGMRVGERVYPLRALLIVGALVGHIVIGGGFFIFAEAKPRQPPRELCRWQAAAGLLVQRAAASGGRLTLMAFVHSGPEIVYRTGLSVVGTPYLGSGIFDTNQVMNAKDPEKARAILLRRGVDYVVFCRDGIEARRYLERPGQTLFKDLYRHRPPSWLVEEILKGPGTANFQLFRVDDRRS